jgi:hypothetical protein
MTSKYRLPRNRRHFTRELRRYVMGSASLDPGIMRVQREVRTMLGPRLQREGTWVDSQKVHLQGSQDYCISAWRPRSAKTLMVSSFSSANTDVKHVFNI